MVSYAAGLAVSEPGHFAFATAQKFINQTAVVRCVCVRMFCMRTHTCVDGGVAVQDDAVFAAVLCSEDDIAVAILRLLELEKAVVEGAGATGLAACLTGDLRQQLQGKK